MEKKILLGCLEDIWMSVMCEQIDDKQNYNVDVVLVNAYVLLLGYLL